MGHGVRRTGSGGVVGGEACEGVSGGIGVGYCDLSVQRCADLFGGVLRARWVGGRELYHSPVGKSCYASLAARTAPWRPALHANVAHHRVPCSLYILHPTSSLFLFLTPLILPSLQQPLGHLVLLDDVHVRAPTGEGVSIHGIEQRLRDGFEQILRREIWLPQAFAGTEELVRGGARDDEVLGKVDTPDAVEASCRSETSARAHAISSDTGPLTRK